jgi:UDP:flavonoid glycosyltransferase YjiC (YdhE family)
MIKVKSKINQPFLMLPSAIGRSHLTRLVLIALELQRQGAKVAFAFKENNQILEHYQFQVFPVSDAVKRRL